MLLCGVFVSSFASVWNPEFSAQLDLDDRQGFIASSAMQQKKKRMRISGVEFNKKASPPQTEINVNVSPCSRTGCNRKRGYVPSVSKRKQFVAKGLDLRPYPRT